MVRTFALETKDKVGKEVTLLGWVNARRDHGKVIFIDLRDRTGVAQVVLRGVNVDPRDEDVIKVVGKVAGRLKGNANPELPTGEVEVQASKIEILAKAKTPPFGIHDNGYEVEEALRLKYRYLDMRRPRLRKNLQVRHQVIQGMRKFLADRDFIEIETPILSKSTPEGARDFIVPSRLQPGKFYALPQSPQQYKQLLMVAGFERYFQIARCFRDEDPRADRAYGEFTQLDLEMSFVEQEDILQITEELMIYLTEKVVGKKIFKKPFPRFSHKEALKKFGDDKFDLRAGKDSNVLAFAWVVDFPLFEKTKEREITPSHHPFTAPRIEDLALLDSNPLKALSYQHDLVCNGLEVGGGSIRITDPKIQKKIFNILGYPDEEVEAKFGHLLEAFRYGAPPHGGIAPGIERLVMVFTGEKNTREVTAFPMSSGGQTAVMDAPSEVSEDQLGELGIKTVKKRTKRTRKDSSDGSTCGRRHSR
ncbi:MAG: hypothetical protein BMS9Abin34_303 [Patescibacteria group bacterium]|nr:MAG: hypothetical protein BMS9Abin34_303 [Patescibacteria group bacterium]